MHIGIVGHGANKFTKETESRAKDIIRQIIQRNPGCTIVSGHSSMGGVDIWAEEIAEEMGVETDIKHPKNQSWEDGYKERNIEIAKASDVVNVLVVKEYPSGYTGRRFDVCYHCAKRNNYIPHVKSGGCWTGWKADELGKSAIWIYIKE